MQLTQGSIGSSILLRLVQAALLICLTPQTSPPQTAPRQVITHEGPLVLKGNQVYTIENVTFIQHGPIEVYDQAQLIIRDSTIEFQQSYHEEFQWRFWSSAQLIMERSTVNSPYTHSTAFRGSARARVDSSTLPRAYMPLEDTASISITGSTVTHISVDNFGEVAVASPSLTTTDSTVDGLSLWFKGNPSGTLRGLRPREHLTWRLAEIADARMNVELTNTSIRNINPRIGGNGRITLDDCDITQLTTEDSAAVFVRNSRVIAGVMVFEKRHHVALRGLASGQTIAHWSLHEADPTTNVPFDYVIDNSHIGSWYFRVSGELTLEDSDLGSGSRLRPENNPSSTVRVIRSYVEDLFLWRSYGRIAFEDSTVGFVSNPTEGTPMITGSVRFQRKAIATWFGPWRQATVTRQFPVRVMQTSGLPLAGLPLRLHDPDGKLIWSGQTGPDGQASFEIAFTDTNYEKTWSLRFETSGPAVTVPVRFLSDTPLVPPIPLNSPAVDFGALRGKYHFVQLLASAPAGETRTLAGTLDFDGKGAYTWTAEGAPGGKGAFSVGGAGDVALVNPIRNVDWLSAYLSANGDVLTGASTFTADTNYDLFVAVRAPSGNVTNALLNGSYSGASLEFAPGATPVMKAGLVSLVARGTGQFTRAAVTGHASDQGGRTVNQSAVATYNLKPDGTGTASFGTAASLLSGDREIFVSKDGAYLVGHLPDRGILVAAKSAGTGADFEGRYWIAGLSVDAPVWSAVSGSLRTLGAGRALVAERRRMDERALDHAGLRSYVVNPDGTGALAPSLPKGLSNLRLVAPVGPVEAPRPGAFIGAQIGPLNESTTQYGIFFGVRAPVSHASGVFLDPAGVVNGASFAGLPYPLAPGAIVSLFGSNLATREARATGFPLPTKLDGVTVTVNGTPAPLYFVSPAQASLQLPYRLTGNWVTLRVSNSRGMSNEVVAPLAATSPGVFSRADGRPVVLHADYSLVSSENPARPGETVMIWLTGLGELSPAVATGEGNPSEPLARAVDASIALLFGGQPATRVDYAGGAPGFAGLNQINATIPVNSPLGPNVPIAVSTSNAHTELVEIPISR